MTSVPKNLLVVKLNALGDTAQFVPVLHSIRAVAPDARITLLTTPIGKALVKECVELDEIIDVELSRAKRVAYLLSLSRWIAKQRFDISLCSSDTSSLIALAVLGGGVKVRYGYDNAKMSFLYTNKLPFKYYENHSRLNFELVRAISNNAELMVPEIDVMSNIETRRDILEPIGLASLFEHSYVVVHLGSKRESRRWFLERFAMVVAYIRERWSDVSVVFVGDKSEESLVKEVLRNIGDDGVVSLVGKTTLVQLMAIVGGAKVYLGHSSGPLHLAYLAGVRTISLWGAALPQRWGPPLTSERHSLLMDTSLECIHCEQESCSRSGDELRCMRNILVEDVIREFEKVM